MRKADIVVGEEYYAAAGSTYTYGDKRVKVEAIGAHKNSQRDAQWRAQSKLDYRTKVDAYRNDPDLSPNQVKAAIANLDVQVDKLAKELYTPFHIDGKGGDVLCVLLDRKTGEPQKEMVYDRSRAEHHATNRDQRILVPSREFRSTWAAHVKDVEERVKYQEEQRERAAKLADLRERQNAVLTAALAERGIEVVTYGAHPVTFDHGYGGSRTPVAMTKEALATLLGVELPTDEQEGD